MTRIEARARYQYALSHPQPMAVSGRLIQGVGYGLLLVAPFWLVVAVVVVRGALGAA